MPALSTTSPWATAEEERQIRRSAGARDNGTEAAWYVIWNILFPGCRPPRRPYCTGTPDEALPLFIEGLFASNEWVELAQLSPGLTEEELRRILTRFGELTSQRLLHIVLNAGPSSMNVPNDGSNSGHTPSTAAVTGTWGDGHEAEDTGPPAFPSGRPRRSVSDPGTGC